MFNQCQSHWLDEFLYLMTELISYFDILQTPNERASFKKVSLIFWMYLVNFAYKLSLANYLFNTYIIFTKRASKNQGPFRGHFLNWQWSLWLIFICVIITWRQSFVCFDGARTCLGRMTDLHPEMETLAGIFWHFKYFHVVLELNLYCVHVWSPQLNCKRSLLHL